ncbi:MAG: hypothetical protein ABJB98_09780 [Actinomycetota bacterium]
MSGPLAYAVPGSSAPQLTQKRLPGEFSVPHAVQNTRGAFLCESVPRGAMRLDEGDLQDFAQT